MTIVEVADAKVQDAGSGLVVIDESAIRAAIDPLRIFVEHTLPRADVVACLIAVRIERLGGVWTYPAWTGVYGLIGSICDLRYDYSFGATRVFEFEAWRVLTHCQQLTSDFEFGAFEQLVNDVRGLRLNVVVPSPEQLRAAINWLRTSTRHR